MKESNTNNFKNSGSTLHDSKISSKGFSDGSPLRSQTLRSPVRSPIRSTIRSPLRSTLLRSPLAKTTSQLFYSPNRYSSPLRDRTMSILDMTNDRMSRTFAKSPEPLRNTTPLLNSSMSLSSNLSYLRQSRLGLSGSINYGTGSYVSSHVSYEEENFISYIRELLELENQLEKAKCDNIIKSDFNAEDAFGIFEVDRREYLTDLDLKYGLNSLDIFPTQDEIALLIKRFDRRGEGILT
jgi:hypothetical protein